MCLYFSDQPSTVSEESFITAAEQGDVELSRKYISDGANVDYHDDDVHVYHMEVSVVNEMFFTRTKLIHFTSHSNIGSGTG